MKYDCKPEEIKDQVYPHFFNSLGEAIRTDSQYHLETMWDHVNLVFEEFLALIEIYGHMMDAHALEASFWGVKLHDIAKPNTITPKNRRICSKCHRPNALRHTHCYACGFRLPDDVMCQHGWHNHEKVGGSSEYLDPVLDIIGIENDAVRAEIMKMVRWHSLTHAMLHLEFETARATEEKKYLHEKADELGFDPSEMSYAEFMDNLYPDSSLGVKVGATLLSYADELGKVTDIPGDEITQDEIMTAILSLS